VAKKRKQKPDLKLADSESIVQRGYRLTRQRRVILEKVQEVAPEHLSADQVYELVHQEVPHVSFSTVYRNLRFLEELGLIRVLRYGKRFSRYDAALAPHYHVFCRSCGELENLALSELEGLDDEAAAASGFQVDEHQMLFSGLCPSCRSPKRRSRAGTRS